MIFFLLFLTVSLFGQTYFESDGLGISGPAVNSLEASEWVLEVRETDGVSQKILYKNQAEYKRWDRTESFDRGRMTTGERYYYKGSLRTDTSFRSDGRIISETNYDSTGAFLNRKDYEYDQDSRLTGITTYDDENNSLKEDELLYRFDNSLRGIEDSAGGRVEWRTGDFRKNYLDTLYIRENNTVSIYSYKDNDLITSTTQIDDKDYEVVRYFYDLQHTIEKELRINLSDNRRTEISYNSDRNIVSRNIYRNDILEFSEINTYMGTKLISTVQKSSGLKMEWKFEYRDDKTDPFKTTRYRNGMIERQMEMTDEGEIETLYRRGGGSHGAIDRRG